MSLRHPVPRGGSHCGMFAERALQMLEKSPTHEYMYRALFVTPDSHMEKRDLSQYDYPKNLTTLEMSRLSCHAYYI